MILIIYHLKSTFEVKLQFEVTLINVSISLLWLVIDYPSESDTLVIMFLEIQLQNVQLHEQTCRRNITLLIMIWTFMEWCVCMYIHMPHVIMMSQSTILAMFYSSAYHCNWQLLVICRSTCLHESAIARNEKDIAATFYAYSTMHAIS